MWHRFAVFRRSNTYLVKKVLRTVHFSFLSINSSWLHIGHLLVWKEKKNMYLEIISSFSLFKFPFIIIYHQNRRKVWKPVGGGGNRYYMVYRWKRPCFYIVPPALYSLYNILTKVLSHLWLYKYEIKTGSGRCGTWTL